MVNKTRSLEDQVAKIKAEKEKETTEVTTELTKAQEELEKLEKTTMGLLDELFAIHTLSADRCKEITEKLHALSESRVTIHITIYKANYRLKQLKYL